MKINEAMMVKRLPMHDLNKSVTLSMKPQSVRISVGSKFTNLVRQLRQTPTVVYSPQLKKTRPATQCVYKDQ